MTYAWSGPALILVLTRCIVYSTNCQYCHVKECYCEMSASYLVSTNQAPPLPHCRSHPFPDLRKKQSATKSDIASRLLVLMASTKDCSVLILKLL